MPDADDAGRLRRRAKAVQGPGRRNIYVAEPDVDVWRAAEEYAQQRGVSLSSVVAEALAHWLAERGANT